MRALVHRVAAGVLLLCLLAITAVAAPDPKAAAHYKQGKAFLDAKQYDQAIVEFKAAYAIDKFASHLFNIADAYDAKGEYDSAIEYYTKYIEADPKGAKVADARARVVAATQKRDDAIAKKKADEEAARIATEKKKLEEEQARKKVIAEGHVKQAEAYSQASAWVDAGNEHRAAFDVDGDPVHLIAAAEAFRRAPDLKKARVAYTAYLEKVPAGGDSDTVRGKLAETTKLIEKADEEERLRKLKEDQERAERDKAKQKPGREPHKSFKKGWIVVGGALLLTGLVADFAAPNGDNGVLDASDFAGPALYGLGTLAVLRGVF
jgi:tetratricopeptide (TPR) repeat protein